MSAPTRNPPRVSDGGGSLRLLGQYRARHVRPHRPRTRTNRLYASALLKDALRNWENTDSPLWHLVVNVIAASGLVPISLRLTLLRVAGLRVATEWVLPGCYFFGADVSIGSNTWINHRCYFDTRGPIRIGNGCDLGMEVMFCTSSHEVGPPEKRAGKSFDAGIMVGDGAWIGARAVVLPGVTIAPGSVVASGAVVAADTEPHGLYAGVPARRVRELAGG